MIDRLVELLYRAHHNASCVMNEGGSEDECLEEEARYLIKYGMIVPPCKVGDTVYTTLHGKIFCYTVLEYGSRGNCDFVYAENDRDFFDFPFAELGKTVFLTREEAEQALLKP